MVPDHWSNDAMVSMDRCGLVEMFIMVEMVIMVKMVIMVAMDIIGRDGHDHHGRHGRGTVRNPLLSTQ